MPPGGAPARTYQVEEKREEEAAIEESQAFSRYSPDDGGVDRRRPTCSALVLLAALAGASVSRRARRAPPRAPRPRRHAMSTDPNEPTRRSRR